MILKSITETHDDPQYEEIWNNLRERFGKGESKRLDLRDICEDGKYSVENRYATTVYRGKLKEGIDITELELSMICDNGYSYFGGSSVIHPDRTFTVEIWID
jgi:hypothetical protein